MRINKLDYTAPTPANKIGNLTFEVEVPILFQEEQRPVVDSEDAQVELSPETVDLIQKAAESIIKDVSKPKE